MSWRTVVISKRSKLDYRLGFLVIRSEEGIDKIYLNEISTIILENTAISLTGCLICELTNHKIKVIFCDEKRNPSSELISYYGSHDTSLKVKKQIQWNKFTKQMVWSEIVAEKIRMQAKFLKEIKKYDEAALLDSYIGQIQLDDVTNREGHAAKVYFNGVFGMDFTRTADNALNAGLNYGYSIMLACFNREIAANGYITQLGIYHDNMYNKFNLGSDLMEPYRVLVDRTVYRNDFSVFEKQQKKILLNHFNQKIYIDGKEQFVNNAIKIYCKSIFDAIEENDISLIKFYSYEL